MSGLIRSPRIQQPRANSQCIRREEKSGNIDLIQASESFENTLVDLKLPTTGIVKNSKLKQRVDIERYVPSLPNFVDDE